MHAAPSGPRTTPVPRLRRTPRAASTPVARERGLDRAAAARKPSRATSEDVQHRATEARHGLGGTEEPGVTGDSVSRERPSVLVVDHSRDHAPAPRDDLRRRDHASEVLAVGQRLTCRSKVESELSDDLRPNDFVERLSECCAPPLRPGGDSRDRCRRERSLPVGGRPQCIGAAGLARLPQATSPFEWHARLERREEPQMRLEPGTVRQ